MSKKTIRRTAFSERDKDIADILDKYAMHPVVHDIAYDLAGMFGERNKIFSMTRFLRRCGVWDDNRKPTTIFNELGDNYD